MRGNKIFFLSMYKELIHFCFLKLSNIFPYTFFSRIQFFLRNEKMKKTCSKFQTKKQNKQICFFSFFLHNAQKKRFQKIHKKKLRINEKKSKYLKTWTFLKIFFQKMRMRFLCTWTLKKVDFITTAYFCKLGRTRKNQKFLNLLENLLKNSFFCQTNEQNLEKKKLNSFFSFFFTFAAHHNFFLKKQNGFEKKSFSFFENL